MALVLRVVKQQHTVNNVDCGRATNRMTTMPVCAVCTHHIAAYDFVECTHSGKTDEGERHFGYKSLLIVTTIKTWHLLYVNGIKVCLRMAWGI